MRSSCLFSIVAGIDADGVSVGEDFDSETTGGKPKEEEEKKAAAFCVHRRCEGEVAREKRELHLRWLRASVARVML